MSFEQLDNLFQAGVLGIASLIAVIFALQRRSQKLLVLGFGYACFSMGTGYYLLHMLITEDIPQVFYVAEICWISTYLFFLSVQILRIEGMKLEFSWPALLVSFCLYGIPQMRYLFLPSYVLSAVFSLILMAIVYLSIFRRKKNLPGKALDMGLLVSVALQECVYITSAHVREFTHFNAYFAADILLTLSFIALLPMLIREEKR